MKALTDAGFTDRLAEMPDGLDTILYKDFGEAQKIAIARALYKDAPFIILDEPTASLDPIAEAEIYAKFLMTSPATKWPSTSVTACPAANSATRSLYSTRAVSSSTAPMPNW